MPTPGRHVTTRQASKAAQGPASFSGGQYVRDMREPGHQTRAAIEAKQSAPDSDRGGNDRGVPAMVILRPDVREKNIDEIRECLTELIRLLAAAPEFGNKARISNCAQVSLLLAKQLRRATDVRDE